MMLSAGVTVAVDASTITARDAPSSSQRRQLAVSDEIVVEFEMETATTSFGGDPSTAFKTVSATLTSKVKSGGAASAVATAGAALMMSATAIAAFSPPASFVASGE